jgi:hypothetical protein
MTAAQRDALAVAAIAVGRFYAEEILPRVRQRIG